MAWKYKQEYVKDGDVVEPSEWRININEMYSELNGFLDSDNIERSSIANSRIKRGAFTKVFSNDLNTKSYIFNHQQSGWQTSAPTIYNTDTNNVTAHPYPTYRERFSDTDEEYLERLDSGQEMLPLVTFDADHDGLLICEFSGFIGWLPQSTNPDDLARPGRPSEIDYFPYGIEGTAHSLSQYGYFAKQSCNHKELNSYVLCSLWRITVNGQSVAESGPLGNDYQTSPLYLVGTTPISKGKEVVVQLEAQFVWYSHGTDSYMQASSFSPKPSTAARYVAPGHSGSTAVELIDQYSYLVDCSLNCPSMIVTYRKR